MKLKWTHGSHCKKQTKEKNVPSGGGEHEQGVKRKLLLLSTSLTKRLLRGTLWGQDACLLYVYIPTVCISITVYIFSYFPHILSCNLPVKFTGESLCLPVRAEVCRASQPSWHDLKERNICRLKVNQVSHHSYCQQDVFCVKLPWPQLQQWYPRWELKWKCSWIS